MWRQFTQWIGGMGIIVLALAVLPRLRVGGRQLLESELPGPEIDQLADRIRDTARRLWLLYVALTARLFVLLAAIGLPRRRARWTHSRPSRHAFSTMPTGGFSTEPNSVAAFGAAAQWVIAVFMIVAGVNYALLYAALVRRRPRALLRDEELRVYVALLALGARARHGRALERGLASGERAIRDGVFQSASIMTTTGFGSSTSSGWPTLALMTLVALMFVGACAGSTSGSIKVVRHLLLGKSLRRELRQTVHPEEVVPIRLNGRPLDERTLRAATAFILLYVGIFVVGAGVIAVDTAWQGPHLSPLDAIAASATMVGNVGPGLGIAGPTGSFAGYSDVSTVTMTILMWLGRLEVIPVLVLAHAPLLARVRRQPTRALRRRSSSPGLRIAITWSPGRITVSRPATSATPFRVIETSRTSSGSERPATRLPAAGASGETCSSTTSSPSRRSSSSFTSPCSGTSCSTRPSRPDVAHRVRVTPSRSKCAWLRGSLTRATTFGTW